MNSKEALKDLRDVKGWNEVEFNKRLDIIEKDLQRNEAMKVIVGENGLHKTLLFCPSCGEEVAYFEEEQIRFCHICGKKLKRRLV